MGIFGNKGSLRDRNRKRKEEAEQARKMTEAEQEKLFAEKLEQIGQTMHKLRVSQRLLEDNAARQRQVAIRARSAKPRNEAKFLREIRKLEFYLTYQWYTENMIDALDEKQMELQTALDMKEFGNAINNADGLLNSTVVDIDKLLSSAALNNSRTSSLASLDGLFERALQSRTATVTNPLSEEYIDRLLSEDVTMDDYEEAHSEKPEEKRAETEATAGEAEDRFARLASLFGESET